MIGRHPAIGNRHSATGNRHSAFGNRHSAFGIRTQAPARRRGFFLVESPSSSRRRRPAQHALAFEARGIRMRGAASKLAVMAMPTLKDGLEHGAIVQLAPDDRRIVQPDGTMVTRPAIGVRLTYESIGRLALPTGKIVAADPYLLTMAELCIPFNKPLPPDEYQVWAVLAETRTQSLPAFALLQISDEPAVRCQLALREDEDPAMLNQERTGGVGVDTGTAAIIDAAYIALLGPDGLGANQPLRARVEAATSGPQPCSAVVQVSESASIAVWRSGFGDGSYTPFWGLDRSGAPCYFAIDFDLLGSTLYARPVAASSMGTSLKYVPVPARQRWWRRLWR